MQRRTFMASLAAAFSLSVLAKGLVFPRQTVIPWERFCDPWLSQFSRYDLSTPWRFGERTIASDRRFLIASDVFVDTAVEGSAAVIRLDASCLAWEGFDTHGFRSLKITTGPLIDAECSTCLNVKALINQRCPSCGMEGELGAQQPTAIVLGYHFDPVRLAMFTDLGDCEVKLEAKYDCLLLRGDGWKGMLMARIPD